MFLIFRTTNGVPIDKGAGILINIWTKISHDGGSFPGMEWDSKSNTRGTFCKSLVMRWFRSAVVTRSIAEHWYCWLQWNVSTFWNGLSSRSRNSTHAHHGAQVISHHHVSTTSRWIHHDFLISQNVLKWDYLGREKWRPRPDLKEVCLTKRTYLFMGLTELEYALICRGHTPSTGSQCPCPSTWPRQVSKPPVA